MTGVMSKTWNLMRLCPFCHSVGGKLSLVNDLSTMPRRGNSCLSTKLVGQKSALVGQKSGLVRSLTSETERIREAREYDEMHCQNVASVKERLQIQTDKETSRFLKCEPIFPTHGDPNKDTPQNMVDETSVMFVGGDGGHGVVRFTSVMYKQFNGPDGGDGGNGGHVVLRAKAGLNTLEHIDSCVKAIPGEKGDRFNMHGKNSDHTYVDVPVGTMIRDPLTEEMLADLVRDGQIYVAARGGGGGKGNASFLTNENRAPDYAEEGAEGERRNLHLEMRTIADVGLVGFPNSGKSTFLRGISRARPKAAPYQFTTLRPHVGVVRFSDESSITIADIPGIIEGAHQGKGLGFDFLRHIQRCKSLLYVIDLSVENVVEQLVSLRFELEQFEEGLSRRAQAIIGNKIDEKDAKINLIKLKSFLEEEVSVVASKDGNQPSEVALIPVSGRDLVNVKELLVIMKTMVDEL